MSIRIGSFSPLMFVVILLGLIMTIQLVSAQDTGNPITLSVSPQLLDTTANPGEKITNTFRLTNSSEESVEIEVLPRNFIPVGEEGSVELTEDRTSYSLADWITVAPETEILRGGTSQDFTVEIDVPENAEPGSHYGSVVFKTIPPKDDSAAALVSQEIAPVILVRIAGDTTEIAEIVEFKSDKTWWSNQEAITFTTRVKNTGSVHFKPKGTIVIKNMFGSEVATVQLDERNVLPDSIRALTAEWQREGFKFGRYTAEVVIVFGDNDEIRRASSSFIIFPYQTIVPVVLLSSVVVYVAYRSRRRLIRATKILFGKES